MADDQDSGTPSSTLYSAHPVFTVEGKKQQSLADAVLELEISDDVRGMTRLEARFENWGTPPGGGQPGYMFFDGGVIAFGKKIEISIGPENAAVTVFTGRVSAIGARFGATAIPELTVLAEDALQFFRMTNRTKTYEQSDTQTVAQDLASAHNVQSDANAQGPTYPVLAQLGQSDLDFLRERAQAIDAQVWLENDSLELKARNDRNPGELTLSLGNQLTRFNVLADLAHQVTAVHAHGYDIDAMDDFLGPQADDSLLSSEARGAKTGADILRQAFGERTEHIVHLGLTDVTEGRYVAQAELLSRGRAFVRASGETEGTAALKVGSRLKIQGVGPDFTGTYFATKVVQRFDRKNGFKTLFHAERPAIGKES
jgi:phage protein D